MILASLLGLCVVLGPVVLRSGERVEGERLGAVTAQGIELKQSFQPGAIAAVSMIPWGDVARVEGAWGEAERYRPLVDALDRAERRLARGDAHGAGELLEPLAKEYLGTRGPTTAQVASALVITRVLGGDDEGAIDAWLVWRDDPRGPARAWLDGETGLCPALPPVIALPALEDGKWASGYKSDAAGALAQMYALAALPRDRHQDIEDPSTKQRSDAGVRLVWEVVRAVRSGEASQRAGARDALRRRMRSGSPAWQRAWSRLGIGLSLMSETDRLEGDAGAGELVAVLVEQQGSAPGLSDLARDRLIEYFESTGRPQHAQSVRAMDRAALLGLIPPGSRDTDDDDAPRLPGEEPQEELP